MRQTCQACGVEIEGDKVFFSFPPGNVDTKSRLRARVCQYATAEKRPLCLNNYTEIDDNETWQPI